MDAKRILNVDDSEFALAKLRAALSKAGFEVMKPANSVDDALDAIERGKPDLVTLDIVMAGTDGVEGVKRILSRFPGTRILMVSAMGQEGLMQQAIANGAGGFVVKPYRDEDLVSEAKRMLGVS